MSSLKILEDMLAYEFRPSTSSLNSHSPYSWSEDGGFGLACMADPYSPTTIHSCSRNKESSSLVNSNHDFTFQFPTKSYPSTENDNIHNHFSVTPTNSPDEVDSGDFNASGYAQVTSAHEGFRLNTPELLTNIISDSSEQPGGNHTSQFSADSRPPPEDKDSGIAFAVPSMIPKVETEDSSPTFNTFNASQENTAHLTQDPFYLYGFDYLPSTTSNISQQASSHSSHLEYSAFLPSPKQFPKKECSTPDPFHIKTPASSGSIIYNPQQTTMASNYPQRNNMPFTQSDRPSPSIQPTPNERPTPILEESHSRAGNRSDHQRPNPAFDRRIHSHNIVSSPAEHYSHQPSMSPYRHSYDPYNYPPPRTMSPERFYPYPPPYEHYPRQAVPPSYRSSPAVLDYDAVPSHYSRTPRLPRAPDMYEKPPKRGPGREPGPGMCDMPGEKPPVFTHDLLANPVNRRWEDRREPVMGYPPRAWGMMGDERMGDRGFRGEQYVYDRPEYRREYADHRQTPRYIRHETAYYSPRARPPEVVRSPVMRVPRGEARGEHYGRMVSRLSPATHAELDQEDEISYEEWQQESKDALKAQLARQGTEDHGSETKVVEETKVEAKVQKRTGPGSRGGSGARGGRGKGAAAQGTGSTRAKVTKPKDKDKKPAKPRKPASKREGAIEKALALTPEVVVEESEARTEEFEKKLSEMLTTELAGDASAGQDAMIA